ncbi:MAG TPA: DUF4388 domain-containing protein [Patescibacteria group bacterium]|nr:DUF4388 domain-containing protein [Patescibacteria group bacterium]
MAETSLRSLLEAAQSERSTGTLTLRNGNGEATSLYFLFGHLFHAQGSGRAGDDVVVGALGWTKGDFDFDPKAKLPSDETVRAGIPDLVHAAEIAPKAPPPAPLPAAPPVAPEPEIEHLHQQVQAGIVAPDFAAHGAAYENHQPAHEANFHPPQQHQPELEPLVDAPHPRRGVKHRPSPKHGREPIPVPAGQVIYDSLKTSFVDFPRLITTLEKEGYTGYVRLLTDDASGLILFKDGAALECMYDGAPEAASLVLGRPALQLFNDDVKGGHGVLDVVGLSQELIDGLYELAVSRPMYTELYAAWVDMKSLLRFLSDRRLTGSVMIRAAAGTGVIILADGELAGAYTSESRDIADNPDRALALCEDANAMIEVKSADTAKHPPLDVDEIVTGQRGPRAQQPAQPAAPPPQPAPPPPAEAVSQVNATLPVIAVEPPTAPSPTGQYATYPPAAYQQATYPPQVSNPTPPPAPAYQPAAAPQPPYGQPNYAQATYPPAYPTAPPVAPTSPPRPAPQLDWAAIVGELQAMADDALGNRARKVKDILGAAEPSLTGIESAIDQIPGISLLFVDSSRLEQLAHEMKARLKSYL